jgi:hypothetical protein
MPSAADPAVGQASLALIHASDFREIQSPISASD